MSPELRRANLADEGLLLAWRNDPETRRSAFDSSRIRGVDHHAWYTQKLSAADCAIFIVEECGEPVGQVRVDLVVPEEAEIDIAIAPDKRSRGIGMQALRLAALEAKKGLSVSRLRARVKSDNLASQRAFRAAGFSEVHRDARTVDFALDLGE